MDTHKRIQSIWWGMIERCYRPNARSYKWYGAKGITVCDEWKDFKAFEAWALSVGYENNLSIDRIDNSKGYSPDNCKWVPLCEQNKNRTNSIRITINGETKILADWARIYHVHGSTIKKWVSKGLDGGEIPKKQAKYPELEKLIYSKFKTKQQMAKKMGMDYRLLSRITNGKREPTIYEAQEMSIVLEVPIMTVVKNFL